MSQAAVAAHVMRIRSLLLRRICREFASYFCTSVWNTCFLNTCMMKSTLQIRRNLIIKELISGAEF